MIRPKMEPPWEFLLTASRNSLQSFELSRLSHAANLRKEISALLDQWVEENSEAMLARLLLEKRDRFASLPEPASAHEPGDGGPHSVSDNFFPNGAVSQAVTRSSA